MGSLYTSTNFINRVELVPNKIKEQYFSNWRNCTQLLLFFFNFPSNIRYCYLFFNLSSSKKENNA